MYVLDSRQIHNVYADLIIQQGKISVYGKRIDSANHCSVPTPTLLDFSGIPFSLRNEIKERIKSQSVPTDKMSVALRQFCNDIWKRAGTRYWGYSTK